MWSIVDLKSSASQWFLGPIALLSTVKYWEREVFFDITETSLHSSHVRWQKQKQ